MGKADYYKDGDWNFTCDLCGAKGKASTAMKTWDGFYVCASHKEQRNPQDFLRGVKDDPGVPWTRPDPPEIFIGPNPACTASGSSAVPGAMIPGCSIPGRGPEFLS